MLFYLNFISHFMNEQLVTADGSNQSDNCSEIPHSEIDSRIGGDYCKKDPPPTT